MRNVILKRLGMLIFVIFGVSLFTFLLSHVIPGDPARMIVGQRASEETLQQVRVQLGLDDSLPTQYARYMGDLVTGDLGTSIRTQQPVLDDIVTFLPATLELAVVAFLLAICIGIPLGVLSAVKKNSIWDFGARLFSITGVSMPVFFSGLLLLFIFYGKLDWFPATGRIALEVQAPTNITGFYVLDSLLTWNIPALQSSVQHLILPACALAFAQLAIITRQVRSSMLDVLHQEYVRTARANGITGMALLFRYALRNALIPTVTMIGLAFGSLLGGAVVTETIFSWPGMGKYVVDSIANLDFPAIMGFTIVIAIGYAIINLIVDMLYFVLDPQIGKEG